MGKINKNLIKYIAGSRVIYERGVDYYERDMVQTIRKVGNVIRAKVEGSMPEPYQVKIILDEDNINCSCSCPYEGVCKHIVAVLLSFEYKKDEKKKKRGAGLKEKLAFLTKQELIELITPLVEMDRDVKINLLNILADKGKDTSADKYYEYWDEASDLLENFQSYGGGSYSDEDTIYYNLEKISNLFKEGKLSSEIKEEFLDGVLDYYLGGNTGLNDLLIDTAFQLPRSKRDWLHIIERLRDKNGSWERHLIMKIYREHLGDNENYLKERMKELNYGLDYYDLVKFYQENGDKEKAVETAKEGIIKGEGRIVDLYEFLFKHYQKKGNYEESMKYLKEIFKDRRNFEGYKRLISFSRNREEDSKWALSLLKERKDKTVLAEIDLYEKRYDGVLKYVMNEGYYRFPDRRETFAEKIKKRYPDEIINFYKKKVQNCIAKKSRKAYAGAAQYISRIKNIYLSILKDERTYKKYIAELREKNKKRPAFLDETSHL